ncbi:MAG: sulfur reduction protein DsrS [Gammaproteobacteria bacterium]|jgi:hypothetical protein
MELSAEDSLRINVLLANKPQAIRIHESSMTLYGLSDGGEVQVRLNPNCRDEQYIKRVKEMLSGHVLGSPGGYPVYLQRWTRMGQMRDDNLDQLLLLGEPEAVVAVVCAPGITDELARRAWWAMEDAENARRMLMRDAISTGEMGRVLAEYLVEYLPFETEVEQMMVTVSLVLKPGLISEEMKQDLWKRAKRKPAYYVGFLSACPDEIPEQKPETPRYLELREKLAGIAGSNPVAALLLRVHSPGGRAFLDTALRVLRKPGTQEMATATLDNLAIYFGDMRGGERADLTLEELEEDAEAYMAAPDAALAEVLSRCPECAGELRVMRLLSGLGYGVLRPVLRDTTAIGSLMRRKIEPVVTPLLEKIALLTP